MKNRKVVITADAQVEDIMDNYPDSVTYFIMHKVSPISCAGAYPNTLGEMLAMKEVQDIEGFIEGLNDFLATRS